MYSELSVLVLYEVPFFGDVGKSQDASARAVDRGVERSTDRAADRVTDLSLIHI